MLLIPGLTLLHPGQYEYVWKYVYARTTVRRVSLLGISQKPLVDCEMSLFVCPLLWDFL